MSDSPQQLIPLTHDDLAGSIAVVTGGGDGIGRALTVRLAELGCHVAACDINDERLATTKDLADADAPDGTRVTIHHCDVSHEPDMLAFRDAVMAEHDTGHVDLVFLNAGVAGGGSMFADSRHAWELTFGVCWFGVYFGTRAFLPLLVESEKGHLINTSSVNGFHASLGPTRPHTSYSAAKFAVKGFSEALITDLRVNAPHVGVSVVMPGHIGTGIAENTVTAHAEEETTKQYGEMSKMFRESAITSAAEAAEVMIDGAMARRWRILIGPDADLLDQAVRADPEQAYEPEFAASLAEARQGLRPPVAGG